MSSSKRALHPLDSQDRINFVSKNYFSRVKIVLILHSIICAGAVGAFILIEGVTYLSLGLAGVVGSLCLLLSLYVFKKTKSMAIKGDSLIVTYSSNRNVAMSVRSVISVKTRKLIGLWLTNVMYNLDGRKSRFFILTWPQKGKTPEYIIRKNIERVNKKKKANHKPGSVTAPQTRQAYQA